jgi:hypothetical protein
MARLGSAQATALCAVANNNLCLCLLDSMKCISNNSKEVKDVKTEVARKF